MRSLLRLIPVLLLCVLLSPHSSTAAVSAKNTTPQAVPTSEKLGGAKRFLTFLATDKPLYRPGETLYARAVSLQADGYFPQRETARARLTIRGPRGEEVAQLFANSTDSVAGFTWAIPAELAGGRYEASVTMGNGPLTVRRFEVRAYTPPRLKSQIEFLREGYGPGDTVMAVARVERAEGGVPQGAKVTAVARVDGKEVARVASLAVDGQGTCRVSFALPQTIEQGEGTLALLIEDGGVVETASKTIPILLQNLNIAFYPEGGELVADLPGRVYVQALRPDGKPADITGEIIQVNEKGAPLPGQPLAELKTVHEGRGLTTLTPRSNEQYALRLSSPSGISRLFPLPPVRKEGATLRADKESYAYNEPVTLTVQAAKNSDAARVTLYHREKLLADASLAPGENAISFKPADEEGVLIATVWDKNGQPLAERLLFRRPQFAVRIHMTVESEPAGSSFVPGGKARLTVETKDESGRPVEAVVGITVTDDAVLEMVEKRDQAPSLPVMVYLENEVKDLADAKVYFNPDNPHAARDVDLLLGTQGWRRFILVKLDEALARDPEGVRRALAIRVPPRPSPAFARNEMQVDAFQDEKMARPRAAMPPRAPMAQAVAKAEPAAGANNFIPAQDGGRNDRRIAVMAEMAPPIPIREYTHQVRPNRRPNDRVDFTETLYWSAGLHTNPRDGKASVSFGLSDSVTAFQVRADAFGNNGALGESGISFSSVEPFYLEAKLPTTLVAGDKLELPIALVNASAQALDRVGLTVSADGLSPSAPQSPSSLAPGERGRAFVTLTPEKPGTYTLTLKAAAGGYADSVTRTLTVHPRGFPVEQNVSGLLGPEKPFQREFVIAGNILPGSLTASAKVHPTPLAGMEEALNALLRQPSGCFEQSSSTNYPLVMAQQYFTTHTGVAPEKIQQASKLLDLGYKRLIGFESANKGYEWFGGDPGHEALTAYGLMQFTEMSKLMPVDGAMLSRTRNWLLSRRDGQGGFQRNPKALDSFGAAPPEQTNLYILWTLLESGEKSSALGVEIEATKKMVAGTKDPYLLALGANILFLANELPAAKAAATALTKSQSGNGGIDGAATSVTRSSGESLRIETTSLAVLAWLRCGEEYTASLERAMAWLFENCKAGRFGSTQSTILALKAINAYDAARAQPKAPGTVQLEIDGQPFGRAVAFDKNTQGALDLPDFSAALIPGAHRIGLRMTGGGEMPFALTIGYNTPQPEDSEDCPVTLATSLSTREVKEGEPLELAVTLTAPKADVPMPLAIIGLPAGLEPRHERLKELVAAGRIAAYEIRGSELVLYWRAFQGGSKTELSIPLIARTPGVYTAPASRVYGYYLEEHKRWAAGEQITITRR